MKSDDASKPLRLPEPNDPDYLHKRVRLQYVFSQFMVPYLRRLYQQFDGDLVEVLVLGEVAQRNVVQWMGREDGRAEDLDDIDRHPKLLRPCNALSVAEASGIPRETVRRRVNRLIERGLLYRDSTGNLFVMPGMGHRFDSFSQESLVDFLACAQQIMQMVGADKTVNKGPK